MFPDRFEKIVFHQKKKDISLYYARDARGEYMLKCALPSERAAVAALTDEYEVMKDISCPGLPVYHGMSPRFLLPDGTQCVAVCMDYCRGTALSALAEELSLSGICHVVYETGRILSLLIGRGVLYTDLHPDNILIPHPDDMERGIILLDFTYCYYFLKNPQPEYSLRFSYRVSPDLKGQQLLIQELALLAESLLTVTKKKEDGSSLSSSLYLLIETGRNPGPDLMLSDYLDMLRQKSSL